MNWKLAGQITGASLLGSAAAMSLPLIFAAISGEQISVFLIPVLGCALLGGLLFRRGRGEVVMFKKGVDDSNSGDFTSVPCRKHSRMIK